MDSELKNAIVTVSGHNLNGLAELYFESLSAGFLIDVLLGVFKADGFIWNVAAYDNLFYAVDRCRQLLHEWVHFWDCVEKGDIWDSPRPLSDE